MKLIDFDTRRKEMVWIQLRRRDITDERVLAAMEKVPRHLFMPVELWDRAYDDAPAPIGEAQTISQPYMVACMTQALHLKRTDRVLEIGTGSGYQTAVLAEMVDHVYTVEIRPTLLERARGVLEELGYSHKITFRVGNGHTGCKEGAPYDAIIVTAAADCVPPALVTQLTDGGRLVIPVGYPEHQILYRVTRKGEDIEQEQLLGCVFVPMVNEKDVSHFG
ncbi:MAG: protein-L-isoaspartate(D-aspartate) O-methyltransferase [Candidatus Brocadiales bacterium]